QELSPPQSLNLQQSAPIVDFLWYPTASPKDAASFCFVSSVRDCPVKLLDASNGRLRASYPIVDHIERFIAPHSMAFNPYGTRLYCGFENAIEVFDVGQPGEGSRLMTTPSKKSKDGLKGRCILSALAFCPSYTTDYFAVGSLTPTQSNIAIFSETRGEVPVMFLGNNVRLGVTQDLTTLIAHVQSNEAALAIRIVSEAQRHPLLGFALECGCAVETVFSSFFGGIGGPHESEEEVRRGHRWEVA
ncbi:hypothetical protein V5O48_014221, partial [Marasmius crinis-equi]